MSAKPPTLWVESAHREARDAIATSGGRCEADVWRGFVAAPENAEVRDRRGRIVWSARELGFLEDEPADSVHPELWSRAAARVACGLFEVVPGIYQVRGMDVTNMTLIEGATGVVVVDPLRSAETAEAALDLYRRHRGDRPVAAVIHTSGRVDSFGGVLGVVAPEQVAAGDVPVVAPAGFLEQLARECLLAGSVNPERAWLVEGAGVGAGPRGGVGAAPGRVASAGQVGVVAPVDELRGATERRTLDGVGIEFRQHPDVGVHVLVPSRAALYLADDPTQLAQRRVRGSAPDVRHWRQHLAGAAAQLDGQVAVVLTATQEPVHGFEAAVEYLSTQDDLLAYVHDQTLRLLGRGKDVEEVADGLRLPPALEEACARRGWLSLVADLVRLVALSYCGGYDADPAHLWPHPPRELGTRYVEAMGGPDRAFETALAAFDNGDFRWAATVLDHVVQADPDDDRARLLYADVLEQLAYGAANATWRNVYLVGAQDLRHSSGGCRHALPSGLPAELMLDLLATRIDGPRAWGVDLVLDLCITDAGATHRLTLRRGVLTHQATECDGTADAVVRLDLERLRRLASGDTTRSGFSVRGSAEPLSTLLGLVDTAAAGGRTTH